MNPLVKDLGEFGLIEQLRRYQRARPGLVAGIGDDAAVMRGRPGWYTLFTTDMLVEGVHFLPGTDPYALGRKAMAVNVSDIAAMGGLPTFAVVALGVPPAASVHAVQRLYEGLSDEGAASGAAVVGGDTVRAPVLTISVALLGEVEEGRLLLRSGALVGDRVCVTHRLGDAAAGLILLQRPDLPVPADTRTRLWHRHTRPTPRLEAGRELSQGLATAAIDLSDGLAGDLRRLCAASGVGAIIDEAALPISDDVRRVAQAAGLDPLALALGGGEDYELLFTMSRYRTGTHVLPGSGTTYTVIGEIVDASQGVMLRRRDGELQPLPAGGFQHF
ncbi:MAG TPA: thiamine-phosphate kinase [Limnochordales bacterium]|nr:thiamine-phosphate kinase [Limnochordales bacterium]